MVSSKVLMYNSIPSGLPKLGEDLTIETKEVDIKSAPPSGGVVVRTLSSSLDPYLRGRMRDPKITSYVPAFQAGQPIHNRNVGKVISSGTDKVKKGDLVHGIWDLVEYAILPDVAKVPEFRVIDNPYNLNPAEFLGALGMPGLTAYSSLYKIGQPKKGETIFISSASGAVGAVAGQIAKHEGLRVVGSVGSEEKRKYLIEELGFDDATNYKEESTSDALKRMAPNGVDIYFENVGGEILEQTIPAMNTFGRIIACGMISQYNLAPEKQYGVKTLISIVSKRLLIQGFIVVDKGYADVYFDDLQKNVGKWISEGSLKTKLHVTQGLDKSGEALLELFSGENFGKVVVQVATD